MHIIQYYPLSIEAGVSDGILHPGQTENFFAVSHTTMRKRLIAAERNLSKNRISLRVSDLYANIGAGQLQ